MSNFTSSPLYMTLALAIFAHHTAYAGNYALIMGISEYKRSPLMGVKKDIANAKELALTMNIPESNITLKRDEELTLDGMRRTIVDFEHKIKPGDRAFIYFSGHGTSYSVGNGQCEKAIVTQEIQKLSKEEFHQLVQPIIKKSAKTFVFLDTCFSGGVVAESKGLDRGGDDSEAKAKFTASSPDDPCAQPSNYAKAMRDYDIEDAQITPNYYLLGAASTSEYAIDGGSALGGFATTALAQCARPNSGADSNGDSIITLQEARTCAQRRVDQLIADGRQNPSFHFLAQTLTEGSGPGGNTPNGFEADTATSTINSQHLMETIRQGADPNIKITIKSPKRQYRIGTDFLELDINSSKSGYLSIFSVGSSGKIYQLFPNQKDGNHRIEADTTLHIPRPEWLLRAKGPVGTDRFLAIVTSTPDRFANLGIPAGPFSKIENDARNAKNIILSLMPSTLECAKNRDFEAVENPCSFNYGANFLDVEEIQ